MPLNAPVWHVQPNPLIGKRYAGSLTDFRGWVVVDSRACKCQDCAWGTGNGIVVIVAHAGQRAELHSPRTTSFN